MFTITIVIMKTIIIIKVVNDNHDHDMKEHEEGDHRLQLCAEHGPRPYSRSPSGDANCPGQWHVDEDVDERLRQNRLCWVSFPFRRRPWPFCELLLRNFCHPGYMKYNSRTSKRPFRPSWLRPLRSFAAEPCDPSTYNSLSTFGWIFWNMIMMIAKWWWQRPGWVWGCQLPSKGTKTGEFSMHSVTRYLVSYLWIFLNKLSYLGLFCHFIKVPIQRDPVPKIGTFLSSMHSVNTILGEHQLK